MNFNKDKLFNLMIHRDMLLPLLLAFLLALGVSWFRFNSELNLHKNEIVNIGNRSAEAFDRELMVRMQSIKSMQLVCDQYLANLTVLTWNPADFLESVPMKKGYALSPTSAHSSQTIGGLTGIGSIPAKTSMAAKEMSMAVSLTPLFQVVIQRDPDTPWVYYTSANGFMYLFPKVSQDEFFFSSEIFQTEFFHGITPEANPDRKIYWSPKYLDLAGKGYMVTVSAPVYKDNLFLGGLSIDISLEKLDWLLQRYKYPISVAYLVDSTGALLINTPGFLNDPGIIKLPSGESQQFGDYYATRVALENNSWSIVIQTPYNTLLRVALQEAAGWGSLVFLLSFCMILIIKLNRSVDEITRLSSIDSLTGLYNRRQFDIIAPMSLSVSARNKSAVAFLIYDLDDFKRLNDTYGHQKGDYVLTEVSRTIKSIFERKSDLIFRVGGEEFVLMATASSKESLQKMADDLCRAIYDLKIPNRNATIPFVTISIGGVFASNSNESVDEIYRIADKALYQSKINGKNRATIF